ATMRFYKTHPVIETLDRQGERLRQGAQAAIREHGLQDFLQVIGKACCLVLVSRGNDMQPCQWLRTLMLQELIKRGVIASSLVISYSHSDDDIDRTINAIDESLHIYRKALREGPEKYLVGRPSKGVYRKYN
ncbi:MAG: glutamate-1-semialdehyde 2,1-aminomutase, partial [Gammaproteobacteria bacterium]|nr:glutamate-1-semialdehyde 2,1-aminomutase [Gammaproteobacteria bacterium]